MKKVLWKVLDKLVRSLDPKMLDACRKLVPFKIKRTLSRFLMRNIKLSSKYVTSSTGHKFKAISEPVFLQVVYDGEYEKDLSSVARQLLREGDNVVDVGANFGWYSVLMAEAVGERGHVYSFEPNMNIYGVLNDNISMNEFDKRVTLKNCGVGEKRGKAMLMATSQESGIGYFKAKDGAKYDEDGAIEIRSLDEELFECRGF
jgi:FkbM family methyltransferase